MIQDDIRTKFSKAIAEALGIPMNKDFILVEDEFAGGKTAYHYCNFNDINGFSTDKTVIAGESEIHLLSHEEDSKLWTRLLVSVGNYNTDDKFIITDIPAKPSVGEIYYSYSFERDFFGADTDETPGENPSYGDLRNAKNVSIEQYIWDGDFLDHIVYAQGLVFPTEEMAEAHMASSMRILAKDVATEEELLGYEDYD